MQLLAKKNFYGNFPLIDNRIDVVVLSHTGVDGNAVTLRSEYVTSVFLSLMISKNKRRFEYFISISIYIYLIMMIDDKAIIGY